MSKAQIFDLKTLKCEKVVVFTDRAEVKRSLKVKLDKGENELIITNMSTLADKDSVRIEGHGEATVLDVVCLDKKLNNDQVSSLDSIKRLNSEIEELKEKLKLAKAKEQRNGSQQKYLHEFAKTLSTKANTNENNASIGSNEIENFLKFLEIYQEQMEKFDNDKLELNKETQKIQDELSVAQANLNKLNVRNYNDIMEITILVDAKNENTEVNLILSYVIQNASWTPKYDIRVYSDTKTMIINYYGMICQSTGEDWNDTQVSLSTAVPSIGGNVPDLGTLTVGKKQKQYKTKYNLRKNMIKEEQCYYSPTIEDCSAALDCLEECEAGSVIEIMEQETNVQSSLISSTFEIPRETTIPSDNTTHKVSIGIIDLKPEFEYESVPKKTPHAFLKAKVKNTSKYAMLAGSANVFLDNNFVAKTELKSYSPQEEFTCSLGVDPSIRIDYKPIRKYQEESGIISKTKIIKYEQVIEVKNTTKNTIKLLLSDQLPLSNDDKIQVKLVEPILKNNPIVKLNKSNNLEFDLKLNAGKQENIIIKYVVEHPKHDIIEFV